jgi:hypothetical protein
LLALQKTSTTLVSPAFEIIKPVSKAAVSITTRTSRRLPRSGLAGSSRDDFGPLGADCGIRDAVLIVTDHSSGLRDGGASLGLIVDTRGIYRTRFSIVKG